MIQSVADGAVRARWRYCDDAAAVAVGQKSLNIFGFTLNNVTNTKWAIPYRTLGELIEHFDQVTAERTRTQPP